MKDISRKNVKPWTNILVVAHLRLNLVGPMTFRQMFLKSWPGNPLNYFGGWKFVFASFFLP